MKLYNCGWANGHEWNIRYWEIWNEPDGINNMWCLPEEDEPWEAVTSADLAKRERREAAGVAPDSVGWRPSST